MPGRVVDLSFEELSRLAAEAGALAVQESLAEGVPVTGIVDGHPGISTIYPDGRIEPLDPVGNPRPAATHVTTTNGKMKAVTAVS